MNIFCSFEVIFENEHLIEVCVVNTHQATFIGLKFPRT